MKKSLYTGGSNGPIVPVGFLDPDNSQVIAASGTTTAYAADTVVRITPVTADAWIAIGTAPTAAATTDGSHLIPVGSAQDFAVDSGDKINSTAQVCITPFK